MTRNTMMIPLLFLMILILNSFATNVTYVIAKESGSIIHTAWVSTVAWDCEHEPVYDNDGDSKSQPFWATVECSSSAGGGHGWHGQGHTADYFGLA